MTSAPKARRRDQQTAAAPVHQGRLDRDAILSAAEQILNSDGLGAMTMRRVGADLGVDPTAIYRHFRNKEELVIELADRAFGRVRLPGPEVDWRDGLRHLGREVRAIYAVHPDFAAVLVRQADETPNLERLTECNLRLLAAAGLSPRQAARMQAAIVAIVAGSGLFHATIGEEALSEPVRAHARRMYGALPPEQFPHAVAAAPYLFPDAEEVSELGTEILIQAIERLAEAGDDAR
jgi:AcrR family transcriptional regulator